MMVMTDEQDNMLNVSSHSVQFSRSIMSDSLRLHESQHARPPCPSPTPGVYPNSYSALTLTKKRIEIQNSNVDTRQSGRTIRREVYLREIVLHIFDVRKD